MILLGKVALMNGDLVGAAALMILLGVAAFMALLGTAAMMGAAVLTAAKRETTLREEL